MQRFFPGDGAQRDHKEKARADGAARACITQQEGFRVYSIST
jgi:hypothetical protein